MLFGIKLNSKFVTSLTSGEVLSKTHPTAANISYSRLASSSVSERFDEHQQDIKSPWESEIIAVRTSVWNHMQRKRSNYQPQNAHLTNQRRFINIIQTEE